MNYTYEITGWKNGKEVYFKETQYRSKAYAIMHYLCKNNEVDSCDVCKVSERGFMQCKTMKTLYKGKWESHFQYIGEDE